MLSVLSKKPRERGEAKKIIREESSREVIMTSYDCRRANLSVKDFFLNFNYFFRFPSTVKSGR